MSITLSEKDNGYMEGFSRFEKTAPGSNLGWLKSIREHAITRFSELGFPTPRDEDWRFTNVAPIARSSFHIPLNGIDQVSAADLTPFQFEGQQISELVFINGHYSAKLSTHNKLPEGMIVLNLAEAINSQEDILKENLAKYADFEDEAFTALNTAFMEDGGFIYIPKGTVVEEPIHLLYISTAGDKPSITNPRNLIIVEDNCEANIIEQYVSLDENIYLSNVVTEMVVGENSSVGHYLIELESKKAFNISTLRVQQARSSNMRSYSVLLGGSLVRNNIHPVLAGEGCNSLINGLYMSTHRQHMDNYMKIEHVSPHCDSRQLYDGVLDGRSRGVFHGRIIVHKGAQKTDAKQTNRNLLLSDYAQVDTKPQLEIYADDVKCTHGATIGQIDENALFYLRSRGISKEASRDIILNAFANETLESMTVDSVKKYCTNLVADWFRQREQALKS
jgi:Fe-S cluster assembly protein SufD